MTIFKINSKLYNERGDDDMLSMSDSGDLK